MPKFNWIPAIICAVTLLAGCNSEPARPVPNSQTGMEEGLERSKKESLQGEWRKLKAQLGKQAGAKDYARAEVTAQRLLDIGMQLHGDGHPWTIQRQLDLALMYSFQGKFHEALPLLLESEKQLLTMANPIKKDIVTTFNSLGLNYAELEEFDKAEKYYRQALDLQQSLPPEDQIDRDVIEKNLAVMPARRELQHNSVKFKEYYDAKDYLSLLPLTKRTLELNHLIRGENHSITLGSMRWVSWCYSKAGQPEQALAVALQVQEKAELAGNIDPAQQARDWHDLGHIYDGLGELDKAESLYLKAMDIWESGAEPNYEELANTLRGLSMIYGQRGDLAKTAHARNRSLAIYEELLGDEDAKLAPYLHDAADANLQVGEVDKAAEQFSRSLKINQANLAPDHRYIAQDYFGLGKAKSADSPDEALTMFEKARDIWQRSGNISAAKAHREIASIHARKNNFSAAEKTLRQAQQDLIKSGPEPANIPKHQSVSKSQLVAGVTSDLILLQFMQNKDSAAYQMLKAEGLSNEVGVTLGRLSIQHALQGKGKESERWKQRAIGIWKKHPSPAHASFLHALSKVKYEQGKPGEQIVLLEQALQAAKKTDSAQTHPELSAILNSLGLACADQGKLSKAKLYFSQALEIDEADKKAPETAVFSLSNLAQAYLQSGEPEKAIEYHQKVLTLTQEHGLGPFQTGFTLNELGLSHLALKDFGQAEEFFRRTVLLWSEEFGENHHFLLPIYENLSESLEKQGKKQEALEYTRKVLNLLQEHLEENDPDLQEAKQRVKDLENQAQ
jgi:tetratricopeptide (TPR) repeat protein